VIPPDSERRVAPRQAIDELIVVKLDIFECAGRTYKLDAKLKDMSPNGFALDLESALLAEDLAVFSAILPGAGVSRRALYGVAFCRPTPDGRFTAGVELLDYEPSSQAIQQFLEVATIRRAIIG
jgi:hypothetical protein